MAGPDLQIRGGGGGGGGGGGPLIQILRTVGGGKGAVSALQASV